MLTELEMKKRAVQAALNTLKKALKPNSGNVIKKQVKRKFKALQEQFHNHENTYFGNELVNQ